MATTKPRTVREVMVEERWDIDTTPSTHADSSERWGMVLIGLSAFIVVLLVFALVLVLA